MNFSPCKDVVREGSVHPELMNGRTLSSKWSQDCSTTKGRDTEEQIQLVFTSRRLGSCVKVSC